MKKALSIVLVAAMFVLSLAACGSAPRTIGPADGNSYYTVNGSEMVDVADSSAEDHDILYKYIEVDRGTKAPTFTIENADGESVSLDDYLGKVPVVLTFFRSGCSGCGDHLQDFNRIYNGYSNAVKFIAVELTDNNSESISEVQPYMDRYGLTFPYYFDTDLAVWDAYHPNIVPSMVFINQDGVIQDLIVSGNQFNYDDIYDKLLDLVGEDALEPDED